MFAPVYGRADLSAARAHANEVRIIRLPVVAAVRAADLVSVLAGTLLVFPALTQ